MCKIFPLILKTAGSTAHLKGFTRAVLLRLGKLKGWMEGVRVVWMSVWMDDNQRSSAIKSAAIDSSDSEDK